MIYIQKEEEPEWLKEFKKKYPRANYDSPEFSKHRKPLKEILIREQRGLCAYCCGRIHMENSHNEHIEPRNPGTYTSKKSLDYFNIVASCQGYKGDKTCGPHKDNDYDEEKFISPLTPECEGKFVYFPDGTIEGDDYTIKLLHLDSYELNKAREATYRQLLKLDTDMIKQIYLNDDGEELVPFVNVIRWYIKEHN